jgi:hypothetical protein
MRYWEDIDVTSFWFLAKFASFPVYLRRSFSALASFPQELPFSKFGMTHDADEARQNKVWKT